MDEKDWELLTILHEEQSISKAAKRLFFTQPTVSAKIKQIEKNMDCKIVIRSVRGIHFTPQGELLCQFANRYLRDFRQIRNSLQAETGQMTGTLSIGCVSIYGKYNMPALLKGLFKTYPAINVHLQTGCSQEIYDMLCAGTIQAGIIRGDYPWSGKKCLLREDPYCVVNAKPLDMANLPGYPMIFRHSDRLFQSSLHDWWLRNFNEPPAIRAEVDTLDACMQLVQNGSGYTLLAPTDNLSPLWSHHLLTPDKQPLMRPTWLYINDHSEENAIVMAFYNYLLQYENKKI